MISPAGFEPMPLDATPPAPVDEAFIVRGHHAGNIFKILWFGTSIDEHIELVASTAGELGADYRADIYGQASPEATDTEEAMGAKAAQQQFFEDFFALPDESTVRFVVNQKDGICDSCVIGNHCEEDSSDEDALFLRALGTVAHTNGIQDVLVEGETAVDGQRKPRPTLEMPAWAARRLLSEPELLVQTCPSSTRQYARDLLWDLKQQATSNVREPRGA